MAKWRVNRNLVPGHVKGTKAKKHRGKLLPAYMDRHGPWWDTGFSRASERNPGYDVSDEGGRYFITRLKKLNSHATWYKPFEAKPSNRRDKRGQGKPR